MDLSFCRVCSHGSKRHVVALMRNYGLSSHFITPVGLRMLTCCPLVSVIDDLPWARFGMFLDLTSH